MPLIRRLIVIPAVCALSISLLAEPSAAAPGELDATFSGDGKVTTNFTRRFDAAWDVAMQSDGKVVVVGEAAGKGGRFAVARYNPNGTLDPTFSGDGRVTTNFTPRYEGAWGVAIQTDGKIVVAGDAGWGPNSMFAVARYNPNGTLDPTFSGDGKVTTQFTRRNDSVAGLALQADGKIVVAGGAGWGGANPKFAVARYNVNGTLDPAFSGDGKATTDLTRGFDHANAVAVQADGKIVAAGFGALTDRGSRFALVRYNANGAPDTTFSGDGKAFTNFTRRGDFATGLSIQPDGAVVIGGGAGNGGSNPSFALARYQANGTLDKTFGEDGKVTTQFTSGWDGAWGLALQLDGKIVAAGEAAGKGGRFALARYNANGTLDTTFSGDGKVTTNFTPRFDGANAVAVQPDGKIVAAGGSALNGRNPRFALVRYLVT